MAELALAIVPLCWEAMKIGRSTISRAKTISHYLDEVEELRIQYQVQVIRLRAECDRVLRQALRDDANVDTILHDFTHALPTSSHLEARLDGYLGTSCQTFETTLKVICKKLNRFEQLFSQFDVIDDNGTEGGSVTHRTQNRLKITFNQKEDEKDLKTLKRLINCLRDLRKIADDVQTQRLVRLRPTTLPSHYKETRDASASFHKAFTTSWSCSNVEHSEHTTRLLLHEIREGQRSCLDIIVHSELQKDIHELYSLQLCIRSSKLGLLTPESSSNEESERLPKKKRVKFASDVSSPQDSIFDSVSALGTSSSSESLNTRLNHLQQRQDLCSHFLRSRISAETPSSFSIGRLDEAGFTHQFFPGHIQRGKPCNIVVGNLVAFNDIFRRPLDEALSDSERLWLAATLVKSALRFYSTVWWPEDWAPHNVSLFERDGESLADSLKTLHVTTALSPKNSKVRPPSHIQKEVKRAMKTYGIHNLTLWGLGVALLQIGLWEPIDIGAHAYVRDKVGDLKSLGDEYQTITKKLINCDFGLGKYALQEQALRKEIYETILGQLEATINTLKMAGI